MYKLIFLIVLSTSLFYLSYLNEIHYHTYYVGRMNKTNPKVYDIGHRYLPNMENYMYLINLNILFILYWLFSVSFIIDYLILLLIVYIIRGITIQLTVLPKMKSCTGSFNINGFCYDKIFSGHVAFLFLFTLFLFHYNLLSFISLFIINLLYGLLIIATRSHYTIDVVVALLVSLFVFQNRKFIIKYFK
jgi:hypothetical protein